MNHHDRCALQKHICSVPGVVVFLSGSDECGCLEEESEIEQNIVTQLPPILMCFEVFITRNVHSVIFNCAT